MNETFRKHIDVIANICLIIVALLGIITLTTNLLAHRSTDQVGKTNVVQPAQSRLERSAFPSLLVPGTRIALNGVSWGSKNQSLLLVLSTNCKFCALSKGFYQQIVRAARQGGKTELIAAFPQETATAHQYLQESGLHMDRVLQIVPSSIGVRGTPTLVLVDTKGVVLRVWYGQLLPNSETEVLQLLRS